MLRIDERVFAGWCAGRGKVPRIVWLSVAAIKIRKTMLAQLTADSCRSDIVGAIVIALHSRSRGKRYSLYTSGLANYRADTCARRG